jgi:hypothetical protein
MRLSFTTAAGLASAVIFRSESRRTHDHILLSQIRDSPNMEGQIPVFVYPRDTMAQLYPQALCSLFVASYDSQGYGGGIRSLLHTALIQMIFVLFITPRHGPRGKYGLSLAEKACLQRRCIATKIIRFLLAFLLQRKCVYEQLPSNLHLL